MSETKTGPESKMICHCGRNPRTIAASSQHGEKKMTTGNVSMSGRCTEKRFITVFFFFIILGMFGSALVCNVRQSCLFFRGKLHDLQSRAECHHFDLVILYLNNLSAECHHHLLTEMNELIMRPSGRKVH